MILLMRSVWVTSVSYQGYCITVEESWEWGESGGKEIVLDALEVIRLKLSREIMERLGS